MLALVSLPRAFTSLKEALLLVSFAILPLLVTFPLALAISLAVGLPVTRLFHRHGREASPPMPQQEPRQAPSSPRSRSHCCRSTMVIG